MYTWRAYTLLSVCRLLCINGPGLSRTGLKRFSWWTIFTDDYFADAIRIYREEITDLYGRGCSMCLALSALSCSSRNGSYIDSHTGNIQFDEPVMSFLVDSSVRTRMQSADISPDSELELYIRILNAILEGRHKTMADLCVGIHLCRGNLTVRSLGPVFHRF